MHSHALCSHVAALNTELSQFRECVCVLQRPHPTQPPQKYVKEERKEGEKKHQPTASQDKEHTTGKEVDKKSTAAMEKIGGTGVPETSLPPPLLVNSIFFSK